MRLSALLASLTVLALAFAGCSGDGDGDGISTSTSGSASGTGTTSGTSTSTENSTGSSTGSASSTSTGSSADNQAPTGNISASVNGTNATFTLTGSDPDGDTLVWDLTFGDGNSTNGTTLPATVNHTYAATGNLTVEFIVTDGDLRESSNVTITVGSAGGAATQDVDAEWAPATNPACLDESVPYDAIPGSFAEFAVEAGTWNKEFTATFDSGAAQDHIMFLDTAGAILLHVTVGIPADATWVATGTVPANSVTGVFFGCLGLPSEHVVYHAG